jgi:predicted CXXCH cytochrome family protein
MKILYISLLILFFLMLNLNTQSLQAEIPAQLIEQDNCVSCHLEMELLPEDFQEYDIHLQAGLSCAGCHGGDSGSDDPEISMSPQKGFIGRPAPNTVPQFCGKCHSNIEFMRIYRPRIATDQVTQYYTSVHGKKLKAGDTKVADCVGCHTAHAIPSGKDGRSTVYPLNIPGMCNKCHGDQTYMQDYHISTNQYEEYAQSVHGINLLENRDLGSPACNDCHGNHGATPPGVESVSHVCGGCHVNNMEYFKESPMAQPYVELEVHACEQCHGYHKVEKTSDEMIGVGEESVCTGCHGEGDAGYEAALQMYTTLTNFVTVYDSAQGKLKEVQRRGMDDVEILFLLKEAHQVLIHTRTLTHTFIPEKVDEKTAEGIEKSQAAIELAGAEIADFYFRRRGFGIASLFITVLVIALFFKIRSMDREKLDKQPS